MPALLWAIQSTSRAAALVLRIGRSAMLLAISFPLPAGHVPL